MKKRVSALLLALVLAALAVGCGQQPLPGPESLPPGEPGVLSQPEPEPTPKPPVRFDPLPLAADVNALTGLPLAEGMEGSQRPLAVTVANNQRSLPQRGLAAADLLVEMLTEGGITRLMAVYGDYRTVPQVGPVRSTRDQFVQMALPIDAIQTHIGTSVYASNLLTVENCPTLDGIHLGRTSFWFDEARNLPKMTGKPNEYCWYTDAGLVWAGIEQEGLATTGEIRQMFRFGQRAAPAQQDAQVVNAVFSDTYWTSFVYNGETGLYDKTYMGASHMDEDGGQLSYTNVFVFTSNITLKPDGICSEVDFNAGIGWYFTAGGAKQVVWRKGYPEEPVRITDENNVEIEVQPGKSYIAFVPAARGDAVSFYTPV